MLFQGTPRQPKTTMCAGVSGGWRAGKCDEGDLPWPARDSNQPEFAPKRNSQVSVRTASNSSRSNFGHRADCEVPTRSAESHRDPGRRPNSDPGAWNFAQIRPPLRHSVRLVELRTGHGRPAIIDILWRSASAARRDARKMRANFRCANSPTCHRPARLGLMLAFLRG